jgi:anti-sigma-K factor RskA
MTPACEHLPQLGAYALGALDVDEAAEVRRHLRECAECAAEYDSFAPLSGLLSVAVGAEAATAEPLSAAFEERLLDAFAREHHTPPPRGRRRRRWLPARPRPRWLAVGAAAVVAAGAAVGATVIGGGDDGTSRRYDVAFRSLGAAHGASARANLEGGTGGTTLHLWVKGLPRDKDAVYEVVCDAENWTATAGTFRTDAEGKAYVILTTALRRGEYDAIRIVRRGHSPDGRLVKHDVLAARLS